jgi:hypothetical protein
MSTPAKVHLTIDTLALAGFEPQQRSAIVAALQAELGRHFAQPENLAAFTSSRSLAGVSTKPFTLPAGATPRQIATQTARQMMHGLTASSGSGNRSR